MQGKRVVVTRRTEQAEKFCERLTALGAEPIHFPTIALEPLFPPELESHLAMLQTYDWLLFTSTNAVNFFFSYLENLSVASDLPPVGVSGKATAKQLQKYGVEPTLIPTEFVGEALVAGLAEQAGGTLQDQKILFPRAKQGRQEIAALLREQKAIVHEVSLYDTVPVQPTADALAQLRLGFDVITFASPSSVQNFMTILAENEIERSVIEKSIIACIGPITVQAVEASGLSVDVMAQEYTIDGLLSSLVRWYS